MKSRLPSLAWPALLLIAGCGPVLVWHGRSPDRSRTVEVRQDDRGQFVSIDGVEGDRYDAVGVAAIAITPDGRRTAYPARLDDRWFVVADGRRGPDWEGVGTVAFTPGGSRLVYAATARGRWHIVVDHEPGLAHDAILTGSLSLAPNGRIAYAALDTGGARVVVDGVQSPLHDGVAALGFSPSGQSYAYVARVADTVRLVVDGRASGPATAIAEVVWPPGEDHPGYLARWDGAWHAVIGADTLGPFRAVGSLAFQPDGGWAFVARDEGGDRVITREGSGPRYPRILPRTLLGGDGRWAYVARSGRGEQVVSDRSASPVLREVRALQFGPDGRRLGYIGAEEEGERVWIEGEAGQRYPEIGDLRVGSRCGPVVFVVPGPEGDRIVVDGVEQAHGRVVGGSLVLDPDGLHWGAVAGGEDRKLWFLVDGVPRADPFDWSEFAAAILDRTDRPLQEVIPVLLRGWTSSELARWLKENPGRDVECRDG